MYYMPCDNCNTKDDATQDTPEIEVSEFDWDDRNERHCARHGLDPVTAEEVKNRRPKIFQNVAGKTGTHIMIGPDRTGRCWTVIMVPAGTRGWWRPVTGWPSDKGELRKYNSS
jgi:uncharacterized DUF497 family protein